METNPLEAEMQNTTVNFLLHPMVLGIPAGADQAHKFQAFLFLPVNYINNPFVLIVRSGFRINELMNKCSKQL